jgi:outer membrane lipoprotein-sorting protein
MRTWVSATIIAGVFAFSTAQAAETYLPSTLTAQQVLARARAARGHLQTRSYHTVYEESHGDSTIAMNLFENGGDYIETYREGDYTWSDGSYGGTNWRQDENGVVTQESGFGISENPFRVALGKANSSDSSIHVLGITTSQPACIVLELVPQPGLLQRRYYDAKTFLLRRVVTSDYQNLPWTYDYDDYRTAYGATFPQSIEYHDQHPENASVTRVKLFEPVPVSAVHAAVPASHALFTIAPNSIVTVPAEFTPDGIIVRVTIEGRGLDFELDSGAGDIVLDAGVARQLGLNVSDIHKGDFSGDYTEGRSRAPDFSVGSLHAQNVTIDTIPFSQTVGDRKVVGLLGGDFFASERVSVNFKNDALAVAPPSKTSPAGTWSTIPIEVDDMVPRAHAKFNAVDGAFVVDLGADETLLYPHFFRQFHPKNQGDVLGQMEGIAGDGVDFRQYTFSRFDFGDLAFADASADVTSGTKFEDIDYDGLLGRNILDNFNLIFDYPDNTLYLQSLVQ